MYWTSTVRYLSVTTDSALSGNPWTNPPSKNPPTTAAAVDHGAAQNPSGEETGDGLSNLSPVPAPGEADSRFGREIAEFLKQVADDGIVLAGTANRFTSQVANRGGWNEIWACEVMSSSRSKPRPSVMSGSARWVRFTAVTPCAVTRKKRLNARHVPA